MGTRWFAAGPPCVPPSPRRGSIDLAALSTGAVPAPINRARILTGSWIRRHPVQQAGELRHVERLSFLRCRKPVLLSRFFRRMQLRVIVLGLRRRVVRRHHRRVVWV